jgi:hypothetical protein
MSQADNGRTSPPTRDDQLEDIVDELQHDVTKERRAEGVAGNAGDRENAPTAGSEDEPPD